MSEYLIYLRLSRIEQLRKPRVVPEEQEALARLGSMAGQGKGSFVAGDRYYENRQAPTLTYRPEKEQTVDGEQSKRTSLDELMD